uniref:Uncharacterized protein n=1 Tax=Noccaea caerulescens TaxID=107243 RepID=A0A1J3EEY1_NOCCA
MLGELEPIATARWMRLLECDESAHKHMDAGVHHGSGAHDELEPLPQLYDPSGERLLEIDESTHGLEPMASASLTQGVILEEKSLLECDESAPRMCLAFSLGFKRKRRCSSVEGVVPSFKESGVILSLEIKMAPTC